MFDKNDTAFGCLFWIVIYSIFCIFVLSRDGRHVKNEEEPLCTNLSPDYSYEDCVLDNSDTPSQYDALPDW